MSDKQNVVDLNIKYVPALASTIFHPQEKSLVRLLSKGRRLGFTRTSKSFLTQKMLDARLEKRKLQILWVDTLNRNIEAYVQRYFMPILKQLPQSIWAWQKQDKVLHLFDSYIDYRSAESPEAIEGFGYDIVILNEAGIILEDQYLWENAILPTTVDNPECLVIIGGTPKNVNLFKNLHDKGKEGGLEGWKSWTLSTYYNLNTLPFPNGFLTAKGIQRLVDAYGGNEALIRQEIFGEFVDGTENYLIPFTKITDAINRVSVDERVEKIWSLDIGAHGADPSVLTKSTGWDSSEQVQVWIKDGDELAEWVFKQWEEEWSKPDAVIVEYNPVGWTIFSLLQKKGITGLVKGDTGSRNVRNKKMFNKRAEMYQDLADNIHRMRIPNDSLLREELSKIQFEDREGVRRLPPKEKMKSLLGRSTDRADSLALRFYNWKGLLDFRNNSLYFDDYDDYEETDSGILIHKRFSF